MSKLIAAHTNLDPSYPGYINFTLENDGTVSIYFRGNPTKIDGAVKEGANAILTLSIEAFGCLNDELRNFVDGKIVDDAARDASIAKFKDRMTKLVNEAGARINAER